jgi:hypothetical protein
MNLERRINVYYTISPQKMIVYSRWIAKNGFGVEPDMNEYYSFVGNSVNGHFFSALIRNIMKRYKTVV